MSSVIEQLALRRFWIEWDDKFDSQPDRWITPNDSLVMGEVESVDVDQSLPDREKALRVWNHVRQITEYKLSKEWKEPRQTIIESTGDCEDYCFLIPSMLANMGVEECKLTVGFLERPHRRQAHVWNVVDGMVVDATGTPDVVKGMDYIKRREWNLKFVPDNGGVDLNVRQLDTP